MARILMISRSQMPSDARVMNEAKVLVKAGFQVDIFAVKRQSLIISKESVDGVKIFRHFVKTAPTKAKKIVENFKFLAAIVFFCFKNLRSYQIVHLHNPPDFLILTALPLKFFGAKIIFDVHDLSPELYFSKYGTGDIFYQLLILFEKLAIKLATAIIVTNHSYQRILQKRVNLGAKKFTIVRNGPTAEEEQLFYNPKRKQLEQNPIIFVGAINNQDNLETVVDLAEILSKKRSDFIFWIVGSGDDFLRVKELTKKKGVTKYIKFFGRIDDRRTLARLLRVAYLGIEPAKPSPLNDVSTFIKIMEYMVAGLPTVGYNLKESAITLGRANYLAKPDDLTDLLSRTEKLLDSRILWQKYSKLSLLESKRVLWANSAKNLLAVYKKLIK